ncbi:MAG: hypothetical protein NC300_08355 [Bacteroidales bacterium]|nr:hypothetical protein [Clostridium sp.]MCM1204143.1 hypothetical protein [Bacteroidales bacterium]
METKKPSAETRNKNQYRQVTNCRIKKKRNLNAAVSGILDMELPGIGTGTIIKTVLE